VSETPEELFHAVVIALLTPMFLTITRNLEQANLAAAAALHQFQQTTSANLFAIAQLIALNLSVTNTLGRAMDDGLDLRLVIRLQNTAAALFRCQDKAQRVLDSKPVRKPAPPPPPPTTPATPEEDVTIKAESTKQIRLAQELQDIVRKMSHDHRTTGAPILHPHPTEPGKTINVDPNNLSWIYTYAQAAEECVKDPEFYAQGNQKEANLRARMLNTCAYEVLIGKQADLTPLTDFRRK
jgi:hypothetical protein